MPSERFRPVAVGWCVALTAALGVRLWNAFAGPLLWGYDAPGHVAYIFYLDRYGFVPHAHQGWGYFHPPLHYCAGLALAQFDNAAILLRGMALLGSLASLVVGLCAAFVARALAPDRPTLPLLAFVAVAFLPVHLYASPMVGNEMTCTALGAAALAALVANEGRAVPSIRIDIATGLLLGLALLSKFTGATFLAATGACILLRPLHRPDVRGGRRAALRLTVVVAAAGFVALPFYARNVAEYGTPFRMNRDYALTAEVEAAQPPGSRSWRDFVNVSPKLLVDPRPGAPHLIHSIWGTAYVNAWVDTRSMWNRLPEPAAERVRWARGVMPWVGLPLTGLALWGFLLAIGDVRRGRRSAVWVPVLLFAGAAVAAFALFAVRVPRVSALKATYLLGLSVPFGVFAARAFESLVPGSSRRKVLLAAVIVSGAASAVVYTQGVLIPRRDHHRALGVVHSLVGDHEAARDFYEARLAIAPTRSEWLDGLAAAELESGDARKALALYERASHRDRGNPERRLQLGVAAALAGDFGLARSHFGVAVERGLAAPAWANRGAVNAAAGDFAAAEADLMRAIAADSNLRAAWYNLMRVRAEDGRAEAAAEAKREWIRAAGEEPRGYPYGVGVGLLRPERRPLLWFGLEGLELARAPFGPREEGGS